MIFSAAGIRVGGEWHTAGKESLVLGRRVEDRGPAGLPQGLHGYLMCLQKKVFTVKKPTK